jgi:hypothetical protein
MGWTRLDRINEVVRGYDRALFAESIGGQVRIFRKLSASQASNYGLEEIQVGSTYPQYITALTHNWSPHGESVDWGIEPILDHLRSMDSWRDDSSYERMVEAREKREKTRFKELKNNIMDRAVDSRREFAKAAADLV